ncbi:MAG: glycosyltransferase [Clostridiales Family XIII bacterium]|nr:glycosyltransferase [Clostridiales Family XIII bacterium]
MDIIYTNKITISVIVPVYNARTTLERCVRSILAQTHTNLEVILVDDGSDDGSDGLIRRLASEDARIRPISKGNGGVSSARNAGLDAASGDFLAFADNDDWIEPDMYEALLALALLYDADVAGSTHFEEREDRTEAIATGEIRSYGRTEALASLLGDIPGRTTHSMLNWFFVWNKLYRKSSAGSARFLPETDSAEDLPFNLQVFSGIDRFVLLEAPFYHFVRSGDTLTYKRTPKTILGGAETSRVMMKYAKMLPAANKPAAVTSAFRNMYWYYSSCLVRINEASKAKDGSVEEFSDLLATLIGYLKEMKASDDYRYLKKGYKASVKLMTERPVAFYLLWFGYRDARKLLRPGSHPDPRPKPGRR